MKLNRDGLILILLFIVLLVGAYFVARPGPAQEIVVSTTYNADPLGVKAFYTLLGERLGYNVGRLLRPYVQIPDDTSVLIVVEPLEEFPIGIEEQSALTQWIRGGGTVVFVAEEAENTPSEFRSTRSLGNGAVYSFDSNKIITNAGVRDHRNAVKMVQIIARHAGEQGLVLFDEYHHGMSESESIFALMSRRVKIALAIFLAAGLVLCHTRGRRFGAVRKLPQAETIRPGSEFIESIGALYRRADAADLAVDILCKSFRRSLCRKLGLSPDSAAQTIVSGLESSHGSDAARRVESLLSRCDALLAGQRVTQSELVDVAGHINQIEQELGLAAIHTGR